MPLYEYVCRDCGRKFETYVRAWGEAVVCPNCRSTSVEKQLSAFALAGSASSPGAGGCGCGRGGCGCHH
jgi:putative FmdB family regulatory protein